MNPPPQLLLSTLTWTGWPTEVTAGDEDIEIGKYSQALVLTLNKGETDAALDAVAYISTAARPFTYRRRAFKGIASSTVTYEGCILGEDVPPVIRISLPGRLHWPEKFRSSEYVTRPRGGPPFQFCDIDFNNEEGMWTPERLQDHAITIVHELPGQDSEPERGRAGCETDAMKGYGWLGDWVTALLEKKDRGEALGEKTEIVWNNERTWAAEIHLQVISLVERVDEEGEEGEDEEGDSQRGIVEYDISATILRVFVKSEELLRLQQPDEVDEYAEEDEEEEESGMEEEESDM